MDRNYFGITDTGKVRDNNEDTFIAEKIAGSDLVIACVIDGVGGYAGGEIASAIAKKSVLAHLNLPNANLNALMKEAIIAADGQILKEKKQHDKLEKMACVLTLVVADQSKNQFHYAHVGDTRLYLLRDHSLVKITRDQSFVGFMEDTGRLTEEQAMRHPKRNEINKALGFGVNMTGQDDYIESGHSPFLPGDILLACSDGLSDMVNKQEITNILNTEVSLEEKAKQLVDTANKNGGMDNITVVLVEHDRERQVHEAAKPKVAIRKRASSVSNVTHDSVRSGQPLNTQSPVVPVRVGNQKGIVFALLSLCFILLAVVVYLLWENHIRTTNTTDQQKLSIIKPPRNLQEKKLQDTLNKMTGNILILKDSIWKSPILITEPLQFNRDTIYLIAENRIIIKRDTSFNEIPIQIRPASKHVLLENFTFEDFNTVISSNSNALVFKNIEFDNCPNAILVIYNFPQRKYINGKMQRSTFKTDSLPIPVNK
ncbi:MAG TPA: PP2C family serine/threonine-protein phosphatase [Pedobacter sp.]|nr:PP2C family serine/threonine-protein phosphatase [Pedobacter sp.]